MKKLLEKTDFVSHYWVEAKNLLIQEWHNIESKMAAEDYKEGMQSFMALAEQYQAKQVLVDTFQLRFLVSPELQAWVDQEISAKASKIIDRIAFLLPSDLFEQVSIQQTMEEDAGRTYKAVEYFDEYETAENWLMGT